MSYYNINTALFNYVSLRASSTVSFHPTVETVGFPVLHFVKRNTNDNNHQGCTRLCAHSQVAGGRSFLPKKQK